MTRARNLLSTIQVNAAPPGKLSDGAGLTLEKSATGGKWIWRYSFTGQRRESYSLRTGKSGMTAPEMIWFTVSSRQVQRKFEGRKVDEPEPKTHLRH